MLVKKHYLILLFVVFNIVGCGGGSSNNQSNVQKNDYLEFTSDAIQYVKHQINTL